MDRHGDGNGWKFGLCFIFFGLIGVLSMGVFSLLYHKGIIGSYINFHSSRNELFPTGFSLCSDPEPSPENGKLLFTPKFNGSILEGDIAEYVCKNGYQRVGPGKKVCMETGEWLPEENIFCSVVGQTKIDKLLNKG